MLGCRAMPKCWQHRFRSSSVNLERPRFKDNLNIICIDSFSDSALEQDKGEAGATPNGCGTKMQGRLAPRPMAVGKNKGGGWRHTQWLWNKKSGLTPHQIVWLTPHPRFTRPRCIWNPARSVFTIKGVPPSLPICFKTSP